MQPAGGQGRIEGWARGPQGQSAGPSEQAAGGLARRSDGSRGATGNRWVLYRSRRCRGDRGGRGAGEASPACRKRRPAAPSSPNKRPPATVARHAGVAAHPAPIATVPTAGSSVSTRLGTCSSPVTSSAFQRISAIFRSRARSDQFVDGRFESLPEYPNSLNAPNANFGPSVDLAVSVWPVTKSGPRLQ